MPDPSPPDLFAAAGMALDDVPAAKPKRSRRHAPPSAAERAAAVRLEGGRRSRQAPRGRVGPARRLGLGEVVPFPLSRNRGLLADAVERLPHGYDDDLDTRCDREARNLENRLIRRGLPKQVARTCAKELLDSAYIKRVTDAHKEAGIL